MKVERPRAVLFVILILSLSAMITTQAAYAQKAQGPKTATHSPTKLTPPEIARRTLPAVVMIECENGDETSQASGFFVRPGILVTNYHVIKNMEKGEIRVVGGSIKRSRIFRITFVLAVDERSDLALLGVVDAKRFGIPTLPLAAGNPVIGETIYAFGSPEGLSGTMSPGIVSAGLRIFDGRRLLQITAPISHGSSGGPVVDSRGQVVGIAVGSLTEGQNLNFAAPTSLITSLLSSPSGGPFLAIWDLFEPSGDDTWLWLASPAGGTANVPKPSEPILPKRLPPKEIGAPRPDWKDASNPPRELDGWSVVTTAGLEQLWYSKSRIYPLVENAWAAVIKKALTDHRAETIRSFLAERVVADLRVNGFENYSHTFELWEFDCNKVRMRVRAITTYDNKGNALDEPLWIESPNWKTPPEHSVGEAMWLKICSSPRVKNRLGR